MTRGFAMALGRAEAKAEGRAATGKGRAAWTAKAARGLRGSIAVNAPATGTGVYAALDLGTNNCRLLIACPTGDGFRVVDSFSRIIRLGEGISATGCISDAAIERAIARLEHLPRQDPVQEGQAPATDRNGSLSRGIERRWLPGPGRGRDRHPVRGNQPRNRGDACRDRLLAAARSAAGAAPFCSTSAGDRRSWFGSSAIRTNKTPCRASRPGCRFRSASSHWQSISAAGT